MASRWWSNLRIRGGLVAALVLTVGAFGLLTADAGPSPGVSSSPAVARAARGPVTVATLPWGSGPQSLGHRLPREGAPEGPSSFAVDPHGAVWVLDQVNERVQVVFRGRVVRTISIPAPTYQDLDLYPDGTLVLLDRLVQRHVAVRAPAGRWRFAPVTGRGLPVGGGVSALFARADGLWLEWAHTRLVRVADRQGVPDPRRPARWGRPAGPGRLVRAVRAGPSEVVVLGRNARAARPATPVLARLRFALPVAQLLALESDTRGRLFLVAHLIERDPADPARVLNEALRLVVLSPQGVERSRHTFPVNHGPEDQLRAFRVGLDGAFYQLRFGATGVSLRRLAP